MIEETLKHQPTLAELNHYGQIYQTEKKPEDNNEGKIPPGFEKFFKRKTTQKQEDNSKNPKQENQEKKEEQAAQKHEEEEKSDTEEHGDHKETKKTEKESKTAPSHFELLKESFWRPDGKGPNQWGWLMLAIASLAAYYGVNSRPASSEINYQDFVNLHLSQNNVSMITLSENIDNSAFKFKATITTNDGKNFHLVLPQIESFLFKLD